MTSHRQPVLGWRLWRARRSRLHSWVVDHVWEPGPNQATCLKDQRMSSWLSPPPGEPCEQSPGENCQCGIWSVWDLGRCVAKGRERAYSAGVTPVMGLIGGWGTVAVHGEEGFRAEQAAILCLFRDSIWESWLDPLAIRPSMWLYRSWNQLRLEGWGRRSTDALQRLPLEYGVPMVRLAEAVRSGLLAEFGLPRQQIQAIEMALRVA